MSIDFSKKKNGNTRVKIDSTVRNLKHSCLIFFHFFHCKLRQFTTIKLSFLFNPSGEAPKYSILSQTNNPHGFTFKCIKFWSFWCSKRLIELHVVSPVGCFTNFFKTWSCHPPLPFCKPEFVRWLASCLSSTAAISLSDTCYKNVRFIRAKYRKLHVISFNL